MIFRYSHPTVAEVYSDDWTYSAWLAIEQATLRAQLMHGIVPEEAAGFRSWLDRVYMGGETSSEIRTIERTETGHDVAAFLKYLRDARNQDDAKWLHYGLTSSDLVDTAQAMRFETLHHSYMDATTGLMNALARWVNDIRTPIAGMTHGQPGEPTSTNARALGWVSEIEHPLMALSRQNQAMWTMKLSGPMGTFAHNPPVIERAVATTLGLRPMGAGATQILPRSVLALWASSCAHLLAACNKVAHDLRLMCTAGEVFWPRAGKHVGSSAMVHKNNPIEAEQIGGFARLARGYAAALEAGPLWLERDISNSSVERVAVPDLWHTTLAGITQLTWVLDHAELRPLIIEGNMAQWSNELWSTKVRLVEIADGATYDQAADIALGNQVESYDLMGDAKWFTRNYPGRK